MSRSGCPQPPAGAGTSQHANRRAFEDLKKGCRNKTVFVWQKAQETARALFNLKTAADIKRYVAQEMILIEFKKPDKADFEPNLKVFSLSFQHGKKIGYLAFFLARTGKWIIKSFKDDYCQPAGLQHQPLQGLRDLLNGQVPESKGIEKKL